MEDEHLGCEVEFTTTNYGITTTPKKEYEIVLDPQKCPESERRNDKNETVRQFKPWAELVEMSKASPFEAAKLQPFEVKAIVSFESFDSMFRTQAEYVYRSCTLDPCSRCTTPYYDSQKEENSKMILTRR